MQGQQTAIEPSGSASRMTDARFFVQTYSAPRTLSVEPERSRTD